MEQTASDPARVVKLADGGRRFEPKKAAARHPWGMTGGGFGVGSGDDRLSR
jgi:hypothetical protein